MCTSWNIKAYFKSRFQRSLFIKKNNIPFLIWFVIQACFTPIHRKMFVFQIHKKNIFEEVNKYAFPLQENGLKLNIFWYFFSRKFQRIINSSLWFGSFFFFRQIEVWKKKHNKDGENCLAPKIKPQPIHMRQPTSS